MNLLAHAYLSFNQPSLLVGNMISDFVKGKKKYQYPQSIQRGIMLHRAIDNFTDVHPATQAAKKFFSIPYRLYSGAFVDVVYDHFLGNDKRQFEDDLILHSFTQNTYTDLLENTIYLPETFLRMLPSMQSQNWLYHYKDRFGIEKSFQGLVRRALYLEESKTAFAIFERQYGNLQECYNQFFPSVKDFAEEWLHRNE